MVTFLKLEAKQLTPERLERLKHKKLILIAQEEDLLVFRVSNNFLGY